MFSAQASCTLEKGGSSEPKQIIIEVDGPQSSDAHFYPLGGKRGNGWKVKFSLLHDTLNQGRRKASAGGTTAEVKGDKVIVTIGSGRNQTTITMPKDYMSAVARTVNNLRDVPANDSAWDGGLLPDTF
ncbi:MAG TPA: hypothetical protein VJ841_05460 [Candidatus Saccharimonadales bacterium]|nr:hypothetical protein [Candidatus Saccharimonadales bacterium]